jgi:hypothetical protein
MCNTAYFDALQVSGTVFVVLCRRDLILLQALSLLLVFGHEPQREAAAVMLFSRVVAPDMFPAVLGACFADASKLRLQQVAHPNDVQLFLSFTVCSAWGPPFASIRRVQAGRTSRCTFVSRFLCVTLGAVIGLICRSSAIELSCFSCRTFSLRRMLHQLQAFELLDLRRHHLLLPPMHLRRRSSLQSSPPRSRSCPKIVLRCPKRVSWSLFSIIREPVVVSSCFASSPNKRRHAPLRQSRWT